MRLTRRQVTQGVAATVATAPMARAAAEYRGPNVVIVRFGGGVRRAETIEAKTTFAPNLVHDLAPRGVLIPDMAIAQLDGVDTSHAEGTVNILAGRYRAYRDAGSQIGAQHLEPTAPTLFEYFRKEYDIPAHQALLINGEDRPQEEFFSYGVHRAYGVEFRSETLSLYRFKISKLRRMLAEGGPEEEMAKLEAEYAKLRKADYRGLGPRQSDAIERFWLDWEERFGRDGLVNPRGDRLLTELAIRAMETLRPRLMMINYQDPDYVHWGNASHYTRAISIIDADLRRLVDVTELNEAYRGNTVFVVVPDCGRDANPLLDVPFQHHFNSRSAHEIWALVFGPGIARGKILDRTADQSEIAATVGGLMGFRAGEAEGEALEVSA